MSGVPETLLARMPKVDLHCHLDGAVRVETVRDLAKAQGIRLPSEDLDVLKRHVQVSTDCRSLTEFLSAFEFFYPMLRSPAAMERIAYELCEDCARDNIRYVEMRFAPLLQATPQFPMPEVVRAALRGLEKGTKQFGVRGGLILCFLRGASMESARETLNVAKEFFGRGVVGIDLAGDEVRYRDDLAYAPLFQEAHEAGIPITLHAGEADGPHRIRDAVTRCHARRIGHGVHLIEDEALLDQVARTGIVLEVCLTSNVQTQAVSDYESHPVREFLRRGAAVTLNTDDRGVSAITLTHEFNIAAGRLGLRLGDLVKIVMAGVDAAFLPDAGKRALRADIKFELETLVKAQVAK